MTARRVIICRRFRRAPDLYGPTCYYVAFASVPPPIFTSARWAASRMLEHTAAAVLLQLDYPDCVECWTEPAPGRLRWFIAFVLGALSRP